MPALFQQRQEVVTKQVFRAEEPTEASWWTGVEQQYKRKDQRTCLYCRSQHVAK